MIAEKLILEQKSMGSTHVFYSMDRWKNNHLRTKTKSCTDRARYLGRLLKIVPLNE